MNPSLRPFIVAVCGLSVVAAVGLAMSRSHRAHGEVNSSARMVPTPVERVRLDHRDNRGWMRLPDQAAAMRQEPATANADPTSPDTLEDPDEIRAWARSHSQYAREWLTRAPEGAKRDSVLEMVCLQIAETNAEAAVALADGYGAGCTNVVENLMAQWADQDLQAAYQWAAAKPPGGQRDGLLSRIAFIESKTDPEDAGRLVAQQITPGPIQDEAAISVLHQWARKDPQAAMNWAQSFSPGTLHDRAINEVRNLVAGRSPSANAL